ncbi:MAG: hypothetical protein K2X66_12265, partial [Cyanobacteria bacterium]|nr:hypothetical protein [Cyanobacteriota bacterium]
MKSILGGRSFLILLIVLCYPVAVLAQIRTGIQESTRMEAPSLQVGIPQGVTHLQLPPFPTTLEPSPHPSANRGTSFKYRKKIEHGETPDNLKNFPQPQVYVPSSSYSRAPVHSVAAPYYPGYFHDSVPNPLSASQSIFQGLTHHLLPSGMIPVPGLSSWVSQAQSLYGAAKASSGNVQSIPSQSYPSMRTPWVPPLTQLPLSRPLEH